MTIPHILFEDYYLAVLYKPAGLMVEDDGSENPSLQQWYLKHLMEKFPTHKSFYIGFPHRLDRVTEGMMIAAKTKTALSELNRQFAEKKINKIYHALTAQLLPHKQGTFIDYHKKNNQNRKAIIHKNNKEGFTKAELNYTFVGTTIKGHYLYKIELLTGRYHQIRAQLAYHHAPIVGDALYDASTVYQQNAIGLIATNLNFIHPKSQEEMHYSIDLPLNDFWKIKS